MASSVLWRNWLSVCPACSASFISTSRPSIHAQTGLHHERHTSNRRSSPAIWEQRWESGDSFGFTSYDFRRIEFRLIPFRSKTPHTPHASRLSLNEPHRANEHPPVEAEVDAGVEVEPRTLKPFFDVRLPRSIPPPFARPLGVGGRLQVGITPASGGARMYGWLTDGCMADEQLALI